MGVSQGSLFLLIYINDIEYQLTNFISLFYDGGVLYTPIYSECDSLTLQENILELHKWANTW